MQDPFDFTTVIFALLAVFVAWKLRSILGSRDGFEQRPDITPPPQNSDSSNVIQLAQRQASAPAPAPEWSDFAEEGSPTMLGLRQINAAERSFDPGTFLNGARAAHEMILQAFAKGDRPTLKNLLSDQLFTDFSNAISARDARNEKMETTIVSQEKSSIETAALQGSLARISVRFRSKLITATRDANGAIIDGSADQIADVQDLWTFSRDIKSRDPNWKLVSTSDS